MRISSSGKSKGRCVGVRLTELLDPPEPPPCDVLRIFCVVTPIIFEMYSAVCRSRVPKTWIAP